uniref:Pleckstrin and Sec7 domain containing 3 n=1 Tax=Astyanax mexicanus TaxID=7994 RepID=A0A8B9HNH2_ASTMX
KFSRVTGGHACCNTGDCVEHHPEQSEQMHGSVEQLEEQKLESVSLVVPCGNSKVVEAVDQEEAKRLAERLYKLENFQRTDVVRHLDKDNEFSRAVGEEYLKFFDFTDQTLDEALRSFLLEVVLIGETQERERVLERFSGRYQECNPNTFTSPGSVLTLTCAVMLLNTDLHGQNVGKAMSSNDFVSNLDGMNEGENFSKDLLKTLYNSIKNHPLEWAVEEKELVKSMVLDQDSDPESSLRSKSNPFQDLAHDKKATVFQKGFLKRKAHADIDGKRTPWGKRSWKTFYAVLKGMVLYLQKNEYAKDWQSSEEVLSVHHSLAERAEDYTKRPHVFRLQTADWRVFLFEASSTEQMNSWIGRINLVSALYSSPPFPAAVGSQRKFCRPILPATQSALTLEKQLQSHAAMLQSFQEDLSALQQGAPEGRKAKARELEDLRHKEEYLQHERSRYEAYVQILEEDDIDEMDGGMKRSHSSPSLELELAPPPVVKVRRNISERRTYHIKVTLYNKGHR